MEIVALGREEVVKGVVVLKTADVSGENEVGCFLRNFKCAVLLTYFKM